MLYQKELLMQFKKSIVASCVLGAIASTTAAWAGPVLSLDLQVHNSGGPVVPTAPTGTHTVSNVTAGQVIQMDVWGLLVNDPAVAGSAGPYTPNASGDGVNIAVLRYTSLDGPTSVLGNYQNSTVNSAQFTTNADPGQSHISYDGKGGTDWGGAYITTTDETNYVTLSTAAAPVAWGPNLAVFLGTIQYQVTSAPAGGSTTLKALPKISNVNGRGDFSFTLNGVAYSAATDAGTAPLGSTSPSWPDGNVYDPANANNSNASSRPLAAFEHIRPGAGVILSAGPGGGGPTVAPASAAVGTSVGTETAVAIPGGYTGTPNPVTFTAASAGSLQVNGMGDVPAFFVLFHVNGFNASQLNGAPGANLSGGTALDLSTATGFDLTLLQANPWANLLVKYSTAVSDANNNFVNFDFSTLGTADKILAVPEPASLGLIGLGVMSLMMRRRRN